MDADLCKVCGRLLPNKRTRTRTICSRRCALTLLRETPWYRYNRVVMHSLLKGWGSKP